MGSDAPKFRRKSGQKSAQNREAMFGRDLARIAELRAGTLHVDSLDRDEGSCRLLFYGDAGALATILKKVIRL